jgi:CheY-like chemotaxis protein
MLRHLGYHVTTAANGRDAYELTSHASVDVVVSDIAMPEFDGFALIKAIRASTTNKYTPAIAYSGYGGANEVQRAHDAGFDRHLTKPIDVESLLTWISEVTRDASVK